jgi:hypothetical protein
MKLEKKNFYKRIKNKIRNKKIITKVKISITKRTILKF